MATRNGAGGLDGMTWWVAVVRGVAILIVAALLYVAIPDRLLAYLSLHIVPFWRDVLMLVYWGVAFGLGCWSSSGCRGCADVSVRVHGSAGRRLVVRRQRPVHASVPRPHQRRADTWPRSPRATTRWRTTSRGCRTRSRRSADGCARRRARSRAAAARSTSRSRSGRSSDSSASSLGVESAPRTPTRSAAPTSPRARGARGDRRRGSGRASRVRTTWRPTDIQPVVFEAQDRPGGMMVLGIPPYRLRRELIEEEIRAILDHGRGASDGAGARSRLQPRLASRRRLRGGVPRDRRDARPRAPDPGSRARRRAQRGRLPVERQPRVQVELGEDVIVVGGGNVALDARDARAAARPRRRGARRRRRDDGRARRGADRQAPRCPPCARHRAREPRARCRPTSSRSRRPRSRGSRSPVGSARAGSSGTISVEGLETIEVASVFDETGRFNPMFTPGTETRLACDSVILAIGQTPDLSWLEPGDDDRGEPSGDDRDRPRDARDRRDAGVYAGGDVAFGPRNLIDAIADGRRAAASIHRAAHRRDAGAALAGRSPDAADRRGDAAGPTPRTTPSDRACEVPAEATERRIGSPEIELGFTEEQARAEAGRCLQCFLNIMLDPSHVHPVRRLRRRLPGELHPDPARRADRRRRRPIGPRAS